MEVSLKLYTLHLKQVVLKSRDGDGIKNSCKLTPNELKAIQTQNDNLVRPNPNLDKELVGRHVRRVNYCFVVSACCRPMRLDVVSYRHSIRKVTKGTTPF